MNTQEIYQKKHELFDKISEMLEDFAVKTNCTFSNLTINADSFSVPFVKFDYISPVIRGDVVLIKDRVVHRNKFDRNSIITRHNELVRKGILGKTQILEILQQEIEARLKD